MSASLILRTVKGTPLTNLEVDNNFSNINLFAAGIESNVGMVSALTTTATGNIVSAVNELVSSNTATNARVTTVNNDLANTNSNIGVLSGLTTVSKSNLVSAVSEIKSGNLSQFASTTSAQLAGIISDTTGTGNVVLNTNPSFLGQVNTQDIISSGTLGVKKVTETIVALGNTGTAATIDLSQGTIFTATLTGNAVLTISNPGVVSSFVLILTNDGTAGRSVSFAGGTFRYPLGSVTRTTTANAVDIWFFFTPNSGSTWYGSIPMANLL